MSAIKDELTSRGATGRDYDDVMAIGRDFLGGLDYLPGMYFQWLHDPNVYMFVTEHRGKVVRGSLCVLKKSIIRFEKECAEV